MTYLPDQLTENGIHYTLRDDYARKQYGHGFDACNAEEREMVTERYPQRISEDMKGGER